MLVLRKQNLINDLYRQIKLYFIIFVLCFSFLGQRTISRADTAANDYVPGEMLIKLKNQGKIYKVKYNDQPNPLEIKRILSKQVSIEYSEPNYLFKVSYVPNDPLYTEQWNLEKIHAPQAWDVVPGGSEDVVVAVLDTGVDIDHPDLKDNIWINKKEIPGNGLDDDNDGYVDDYNGWDFIRNSPDPRPKFDESYAAGPIHHGTLVAGLIAAKGDNQIGVAGLAWKTKIMPLRVLNSQGSGSVEAVINAVNYAKAHGAKIINLSFVGNNRSEFLAQALKQAWRDGLIVVAAAGNESTGQTEDLDQVPSYPICSDAGDSENYIIGVGATDQVDRKASFSNYGSKCIDIMAPGSRIYGLLAYDASLADYKEYYGGYWSGTSVAVPLVSGTAALMKALSPLVNNQRIRDTLLNQADNIDTLNPDYAGKIGRGRLNVFRAVSDLYAELIQAPQSRYIIASAGPGGEPQVKVIKSNGLVIGDFLAYAQKFTGGVRVASGDVDGDGSEEIITVPASIGGAHVRIFDQNGQLKGHFFALKGYNRGLNVSACDLDGDKKSEIIVSSNGGREPEVFVFDNQGQLREKFLAYARSFRGEIKVTCGDVDGDGENEIVTVSGKGGGPHVRVFNRLGWPEIHWFAFLERFRGGINVAVGDVNNDGRAEIIVSIAGSASPYIRVFDYFGFLQTQFLAYNQNYYQGVTLAVSDLNDDGKAEIVTGTGQGATPHVRIFDYLGIDQGGFFAYDSKFLGGINLAVVKAP